MAENRSPGRRLPWAQLPGRLVLALEDWAGARIVSAVDQAGGFSPGPAARVATGSGRRFFVKAVGPELNPESPMMHRREAAIAAALPVSAPAPQLLWHFDEGPDGWVVLVFEDIDGVMPGVPWKDDDLRRVVEGMKVMGSVLTPSPVPTALGGSVGEHFREDFCGWRILGESPQAALDPWIGRHLEKLIELESQAVEVVSGDSLVHLDIRSDNVLLTDDKVFFVDWPHARVGAPWVDLVLLAPSVTLEGGPEPEELLALYGVDGIDPAAIDACVAALAGYFVEHSLRPPPAGIPTVRAFQAAQGRVAVDWLKARTCRA